MNSNKPLLGLAYGKFGELLQGDLPGIDNNFLVSLTISKTSLAQFTLGNQHASYSIDPSHKKKSLKLVLKILNYLGIPDNRWKLIIESELPEGKGLGSSTTDLVATARAIENVIGKRLPLEILLQFLREIEPSDGIMFDNIVCFYHRQVKLHSELGYLSNLAIIGIDEGGIIDTIEFNKHLAPYADFEKERYKGLLADLIKAIKVRDLTAIGKISTTSALLHQKFNPKKHLDYLIELADHTTSSGIIVAHSGTYIGVVIDKNQHDYIDKIQFIKNILKERSLSPSMFDVYAKI